eukprot:403267_1
MAEGLIEITSEENKGEIDESATFDYAHYLEIRIKEAGFSTILNAFIADDVLPSDLLCGGSDDIQDLFADLKESNKTLKITTKQKLKFIRVVMEIKDMKKQQKTPTTTISKKKSTKNIDLKRMVEVANKNNIDLKIISQMMEYDPDVDVQSVIEMAATNQVNFIALFKIIDSNKTTKFSLNEWIEICGLVKKNNINDLNIITKMNQYDPDVDLKSAFQMASKEQVSFTALFKVIDANQNIKFPFNDWIGMAALANKNNIDLKIVSQMVKYDPDVDVQSVIEMAATNQVNFIALFKIIDSNKTTKFSLNEWIEICGLVKKNNINDLNIITKMNQYDPDVDLKSAFQMASKEQVSFTALFKVIDANQNIKFPFNDWIGMAALANKNNIDLKIFSQMVKYDPDVDVQSVIEMAAANQVNFTALFKIIDSNKNTKFSLNDWIGMAALAKKSSIDLGIVSKMMQYDPNVDLKSAIEMAATNQVDLTALFKIINASNNSKFPLLNGWIEIAAHAKKNNVELKAIGKIIQYDDSIDVQSVKRLIEIGPDATSLFDKIENEKTGYNTFNEEKRKEFIKKLNDKTIEYTNKLNTEYESILNEIKAYKENTHKKIQFYSTLYGQHVQNYPTSQQQCTGFFQDFIQCVSDPNNSTETVKHSLQQLKERVDVAHSTKPSRYSDGISLYISNKVVKKHVQKLWSFSHSNVSVKLHPMTLEANVSGNLVHLKWGPRPWTDKENELMMNLLEFDALLVQNFALVIQYAEYDDEKKEEDDLQWRRVEMKIKNRAYEEQKREVSWVDKCTLSLENSKAYKIRMKYVYAKIGESNFSEVVAVQTLDTKPLEQDLCTYEAVWSDKYRSQNTQLSEDNKQVTSTADHQCIKAKFELKKGTKTSWTFITENIDWYGRDALGVVYGKHSETNPMVQYTGDTIKSVYGISVRGITTDGHCKDSCVYNDSHHWIWNFPSKKRSRVQVIADYTKEKCTLLYIVNGLVLTPVDSQYSMEIRTLADDQHLYPCFVMKQQGALCQMENVIC